MNAGRRSEGNLLRASVICSIPGTRNGWEMMLYGKLGFKQLEVTNDSRLAAGEPGRGAVTKLPVFLLESR